LHYGLVRAAIRRKYQT